jgi:glucose/arabinose dehydrogenase
MLAPMPAAARRAVLVCALGVGVAACGAAADAPSPAPARAAASVRLARVGTFEQPLYVTGAPGDRRRLFVVEQGGRIMIVRGGRKVARPFLDIRALVTSGGEQGLLSVAFPHDYARSGRFYVYYTDRQGRQAVVEYRRATADRARSGSARLVLRMSDPEGNHNGGLMKFGPDGLLYIGTGDGGGAGDSHGARGNAQNLGSLLGKLLRIDPRSSGSRPYRVPTSNPFVGRSGARPEIYSYGLRNPWRFSFDRATGDLYIGDVGQDAVEEVDFALKGRARGANFGWRPFEGTRHFAAGEDAPGHVSPVVEHLHGDGWCSITGGYVVRDSDAPTSIRGLYVYGDFCLGRIYGAAVSQSGRSARTRRIAGLPRIDNLSSFGEDTQGRVYVVSLSGTVSRLAAG